MEARYQDSNRKDTSGSEKTAKTSKNEYKSGGVDMRELLEKAIEEIEEAVNNYKTKDLRNFEKYLDTFQSRKKDLLSAADLYNELPELRTFVGRIMMLCEHGLHKVIEAGDNEADKNSAIDTTRAILTQILIDEFGKDRLKDIKTQ